MASRSFGLAGPSRFGAPRRDPWPFRAVLLLQELELKPGWLATTINYRETNPSAALESSKGLS